jgi:hypothetical protein
LGKEAKSWKIFKALWDALGRELFAFSFLVLGLRESAANSPSSLSKAQVFQKEGGGILGVGGIRDPLPMLWDIQNVREDRDQSVLLREVPTDSSDKTGRKPHGRSPLFFIFSPDQKPRRPRGVSGRLPGVRLDE